jgi:hypothetical protein
MKKILTSFCGIFAISSSAHAVIVAGAHGGGNTTNNTTRTQLESQLATTFPAYSNVISYSDATGVYLGYNSTTKDVWVLTARHITSDASAGATVTIDGLSYNRQADGPSGLGFLPGGDVRLVRYSRGDLAVPSLPAVQVSTTVPVTNAAIVVIGRGQNRTENAATNALLSDASTFVGGPGYNWSGTNIQRWGTNNVEGEFPNSLESTAVAASGPLGTFSIGGYDSIGYITDFDQPGLGGWLISNEAQGSLGDSGGGAFTQIGGQWRLSGVYSAIATATGQPGSTAGFGNVSILTDLSSYSSSIQTSIGTILIPESQLSALLALAAISIATRRKRSLV